MRDFLKTTGRWLRVGWFWPLALLALPMCTFDFDNVGPQPPDQAFFPGDPPVTSAVMCDIPKVVVEENSDCAEEEDLATGMSLAHAALALNLGVTNPIVLDFSSTCSDGMPRKIEFYGTFPDGLAVCLNCDQQIPEVYHGRTEVCIAKCKDLINFGGGPLPAEGVDTFCAQKARTSTNFNRDVCYEGFCTMGGTPDPNSADPRRNPENVTWMDFVSDTTADGSALSFAGPDTGVFSGGAASAQLIEKGDAWVEFEVGETGVSHGVGVRTSCGNVTSCPDMDPTAAGLPLWLSLNRNDGDNVYIIENGDVLAGPFAPYVPGERFRIQVTDHNDNTADIAFFRYTTPCVPNMACSEPPFFTYTGSARPNYPLRVDAIFREADASLLNVTIMRIIE